MRKLRIGLITTHPPGTGSLNEYAFHFVRYLRQKEEVAEVILFLDELPPGQGYEFAADPELAPVQTEICWRFGALDNALRIRRAVARHAPDVVLFNIQFASFGSGKVPATLGLMTPALLKTAGTPTVVLLHNIMETVDLRSAGFGGNPLMERLIRTFGTVVTRILLRADMVALTIPKYVEIVEEKYGADNVMLAPHGSFDEAAPPDFALPDGPLQIMTFGKFGTYKRVETLVEAFQILQDGRRPPLELVVAGGDSPNAQGYLESIRQQYAHVPNIRFTGYVPEDQVPVVFGEAAVVVFPYTSTTGSSGVLHQAGDYGKAAVLPNIGDLAALITEEGYAGEFFQPDDAQSMAAAIARVIDDPAKRMELGQINYAASRGLHIAQVVDWYLIHFDTLLQQRADGSTRPATQASRT